MWLDDSFLSALPNREMFPKEMPRYPNLWLMLAEELVLLRQYPYALRFWEKLLDDRLELRDSFYDDVRNPNLLRILENSGEGSDFQARIGPFQPYEDPRDPANSHRHQLHARFYAAPLSRSGSFAMTVPVEGRPRTCFVLPAGVHYEVATEEESHPYVDSCPLCGITGEYALPVDPDSEDYCLKIHDPLGIELILRGTVRGERVFWPNGRPVAALEGLAAEYDLRIREFLPGIAGSLRLGVVFLGPKGG